LPHIAARALQSEHTYPQVKRILQAGPLGHTSRLVFAPSLHWSTAHHTSPPTTLRPPHPATPPPSPPRRPTRPNPTQPPLTSLLRRSPQCLISLTCFSVICWWRKYFTRPKW
jgi:hypothetical protein